MKTETIPEELIEQRLFTSKYVEQLYIDLIESDGIEKYKFDEFPFEENYPKGSSQIYVPENVDLIMPTSSEKNDLQNTKIIYEVYKDLTPTQASDPRLWTYLTHAKHWDYMTRRWPISDTKNPVGRITDRYFLRRLNLEALTRNGIARLWWYGYLTYDQTRTNPWELTEVLLSRADLTVGITERAIGCHYEIRTALLEFLGDNPGIGESETKTRELLVNLNLTGGVKNLPFLSKSEIKNLLKNL